MPEKRTLERARRDKREGKPASRQAGEFVREEMEKLKRGDPRLKSRKQAVAAGLSMARREGVDLPPPESGRVSARTERSAQSAYRRGQKEGPLKKTSPKRGSSASRGRTSASKKSSTSSRASKGRRSSTRKSRR